MPSITMLLDFEEALAEELGRRVDVVERKVVEASPNYLRRHRILREAEPVYVATASYPARSICFATATPRRPGGAPA